MPQADLWTDDFLESMRQETDPVADKTVTALFESGQTDAVSRLHLELIKNNDIAAAAERLDSPDPLQEYLEATSKLPDWADMDAIRRAEQILTSHGLIAFVILGNASLPECYTDRRGIPVLWMSQRLNEHVYRRIVETAQFLLNIQAPGGLGPDGNGIITIQKVRLMHASMRYLIEQEPEEERIEEQTPDIAAVLRASSWDKALGKPINQEDLAFTLQTFCWVTIRSMRRLGGGLSPSDETSLVKFWNAVGHVLGVRHDLMPDSVANAELLFEKIKARVSGPSEEGKSMAAAVIEYQQNKVDDEKFKFLPLQMMYELMDDKTCEMLGVPELNLAERIAGKVVMEGIEGIVHVDSEIFNHFSPARKGAEYLFQKMLGEMFKMPRGWERELFAIPTDLAHEWKINKV